MPSKKKHLHEVVIGIDPGLDGGIAFISKDRKTITRGIKMLTIGQKGKGKRELALQQFAALLKTVLKIAKRQYFNIVCVFIEQVHAMPKQGVTSMFNFGMGYGMIRGVCAGLNLPVSIVAPTLWKKEVLAGTTRDKDAAIVYCQKHYPNINLIPGDCRTPQDGIADAVCIAEYGLRCIEANDKK